MPDPKTPQNASGRRPEGQDARRREQAPSYDPSKEDYAGIASADLEGAEGLQAAKDFAEMIVDTVREALLVLDLDLRVEAANESFYQTFQARPEETLGRHVYELGGGQWDLPELRQLLEEVLPEEKIFNDFEVEHEVEHIGRRSMLLNARQLDEHQFILLAIEDVTERRQTERELRESQQRFDLIVENAREYAIITTDAEGRITSWNVGAEELLGWEKKEVLGESFEIIFTREDREAGLPRQGAQQAVRKGAMQEAAWLVRKDGSRFWADGFTVALLEEGQQRGFFMAIRDDTERKEAVEALEALTETLEERVGERTRQVRRLASRLTMAEQAERQRIAQVLHDDLQQHLYGVAMMLHLAEETTAADEQQKLRGQARAILEEATELTRTLSTDLSPPIFEGQDLAHTLDWLAVRTEEQHGLRVDVEVADVCRLPSADMRILVYQILRELLFNVVKHAGTERATLRAWQEGGQVLLRVEDEGPGFDPAGLEERPEGQSGFGLRSVQERLELVGGHFEIGSAPGEGTRATVTVPTAQEGASGSQA